MGKVLWRLMLSSALGAVVAVSVLAQRGAPMTDAARAERWQIENELASLAVIERKVMIPMRDGIRIPADIYRPKDTSKKYPIIWVRTPYNFNYWDVANGVPRNMTAALTAVKHGYAYVDMQERGQFFAEGEWDVLGAPLSDGDDEVNWMTSRPWSNGKVGTTGCSSTAEWQLAVVALNNPGYAAFNAQGFGCGVGRIGPVLRAGKLVPRRRVHDVQPHLVLHEPETAAPELPLEPVAGGPDPPVEVVGPGGAPAAGGLVENRVLDTPRSRHPPEAGRYERPIRRSDIGRQRRRDDQAHAERPAVVQGRPLARQHAGQCAGTLVHVVLRHRHRAQPRDIQLRPEDRERGGRQPAVGGHRAGRTLRVHARDRAHDRR